MISPAFLLVEPREEGNVGMVARAMANFGLSRLVLVGAPARPDATDPVTARAEGRRILDGVARAPDLRTAATPFQVLVGVTRRHGKHRQPDLLPAGLPAFLDALPEDVNVGFVFGRESDGLTSEEMELCGRRLTIPTAPEAPSLNLAQAATITAFSIFTCGLRGSAAAAEPPATQADLDALFLAVEDSLSRIGFLQGDRAADTMRTLRRLLSRAQPSEREVRLLRSLARKRAPGG